MSVPDWLTDPEHDTPPLPEDHTEWWTLGEGWEPAVPVHECDHPTEEVMTSVHGQVQCHRCGLVVDKKPIMSDDDEDTRVFAAPRPPSAWNNIIRAVDIDGLARGLYGPLELVFGPMPTTVVGFSYSSTWTSCVYQVHRRGDRVTRLDGTRWRWGGRRDDGHWIPVAPARYRVKRRR